MLNFLNTFQKTQRLPSQIHCGYQFGISLSFVLGLSTLTGCVNDAANRYYLNEHYPAKEDSNVEVLQSPPSKPFVTMADFQARNVSINYMRSEAAKIGADAVIVTLLGGTVSRDQVWPSQDNYSNTYTRITGTAIKYK